MEVLELLQYVNKGLEEGKSVTAIGRELGLNESSIRKKLNKNGYKREGNRFVLKEGITSNITPKIEDVAEVEIIEANEGREVIKTDPGAMTLNVDMDKLNILLNNIDKLLRLVPNDDITSNITQYRSGNNRTISLRCDSGLYEAVKERAKRDNINIADIINKALEDYLKNYL